MIDEWREFTGESREAAVELAKRHFSVSEEKLDVRVVPESLAVAGLGARTLLLVSIKDELPTDLSDVGEFLLGVLQRMGLSARLRIAESDDDGDLVFKLSGPALEQACRKDHAVVGSLAHVAERAAQEILGEEVTVRIEVPRTERAERSERGERRDSRREGRGDRDRDRKGRGGDSRRRADDRGRGDDRGRRGRRSSEEDDGRLERMAREVAEQVRQNGGERVLDAMTSRERWVVHNAIKDMDGVTSESVGERDEKRVKISAL